MNRACVKALKSCSGRTPLQRFVVSTLHRSLERAAEILKPIEALLDHVDARGVAQPDGAIVAEGDAGHDRDIRLAQKPIGEIL